jgi:ribonuclease HI
MKHITLYTDGACRNNPGIGGWAAITIEDGVEKFISGAEDFTTNNRMEMMAVIQGLSQFPERCSIELYTDSKYVKDGCESWMHQWIKNDWRTAVGLPVKNRDLWLLIYDLFQQHDIKLFWVKGHTGDPLNEKADQLANKAISAHLKKRFANV